MRLLHFQEDGEPCLVDAESEGKPAYAILSHTWGEDELTFQDMKIGTGKHKEGCRKILFCGEQARRDGLWYFWVDTCCINKKSSHILSEAINAIFSWYKDATKCYVYLSDVSIDTWNTNGALSLRKSRWFTRGWTLQELIAPKDVKLHSQEENFLGDKHSLAQLVFEISGIPTQAICGEALSSFTTEERMSWTRHREIKRGEDIAHSLLGLFNVRITLDYGGEQERAFERLQNGIYEATLRKLHPWMNSMDPSSGQIGYWVFIPSAPILVSNMEPLLARGNTMMI